MATLGGDVANETSRLLPKPNTPVCDATNVPVVQASRWQQWWSRNRGMLLVLGSVIFGALMNATARLLETSRTDGHGMHPFQILFIRMSVTFVLSTIYMWYKNIPNFPLGTSDIRGLLLLRGFAGFVGVYGLYCSLQYLPLADATIITFLTPVITSWSCALFLGQPITWVEQFAGFTSFLGIFVIVSPNLSFLHPETSPSKGVAALDILNDAFQSSTILSSVTTAQTSKRVLAIAMALLGVVGASCAYTLIRVIGSRAHPLISVNYFAFTCTVSSTIALLFIPNINFELPVNGREWMLLGSLGIYGFLLQFLLTAGLQADKSSRATNMMYAQILFSLIFDKVIWGIIPTLSSVIGGTLILGSTICVALAKGASKDKAQKEEVRDEESGLQQDDDHDDVMEEGGVHRN